MIPDVPQSRRLCKYQMLCINIRFSTNVFRRPAPSNLAPNVTTRCGRYYAIDLGDNCSTVILKFNILLKDLHVLACSVLNQWYLLTPTVYF